MVSLALFQALFSKAMREGGGGGGGEGESLVTSIGKVVDFRHLILVVPIILQSEITFTCDILSAQQKQPQS